MKIMTFKLGNTFKLAIRNGKYFMGDFQHYHTEEGKNRHYYSETDITPKQAFSLIIGFGKFEIIKKLAVLLGIGINKDKKSKKLLKYTLTLHDIFNNNIIVPVGAETAVSIAMEFNRIHLISLHPELLKIYERLLLN